MAEDKDNLFGRWSEDFDGTKIVFEQMAKIMAPMYRALKAEGLAAQEAAALTAAYWGQMVPVEGNGPQDGS